MSDTLNLTDTFWPNGLKEDSEGYAIVYPIGSNKIQVPTIDWPEGDTLISPFVYKNEKLVGFVDTKAMTVNSPTTIELPYKHIEVKFTSIDEGTLTVIAPNAIFEKYIWKNSTTGGTVTFKYMGCTTVNDVIVIEPNYKTVDIVDGAWTERLDDLGDGYTMFESCTNLTSFTSNLSSLTNGEAMFYNCYNLTQFDVDLPKLENGDNMFYLSKLSEFHSDLSSLTNGERMFFYCNKLTQFNTDLSELENGKWMFTYCELLADFNSNLSSLTNSKYMFSSCTALTNFDAPMNSLVNADYLFDVQTQYCRNLSSFKSDLPNLESGEYMFRSCNALTTFDAPMPKLTTDLYFVFSGCSNLTTFKSDLSSITQAGYVFGFCEKLTSFDAKMTNLLNGSRMFYSCTSLTSFNSDLSSLTNGHGMFFNCALDTASVQNIADTINYVNDIVGGGNQYGDVYKQIHISIGNSSPNEQEEEAFNTIASKGWGVYVNGASTPWTSTDGTAITPIDGEQTVTPIPYYAKPIPATEETAEYVDGEGNYYNVLGAQFIYGDDLSTYGMFTCLDDAVANMRLTKYERPVVETV